MASAAAVATDISRSPVPEVEVDETLDTIGGTQVPDTGFESDDDDITHNRRVKTSFPARNLQEEQAVEEHDEAALFGSDSEAAESAVEQSRNELGSELENGEDEEMSQTEEQSALLREDQAMDVDLARAPVPEPSDGEFYLLKVPSFFGIDPVQFKEAQFKAPVTDHHSRTTPSSTFSAYNTAMSTIRWRRSPSNPAKLQSNTRVVRWSDGSLTLQFASRPGTHYPIAATALAPPQTKPLKPTPMSIPSKARTQGYDPAKDTFTYLAAPQELAGMLRITNKFTAGLKVQSATDASAEALERLQNSLAAATASQDNQNGGAGGISMVRITEDPELAKKKAELAEKEKMKASKRREAQELRDRERQGRVMGRRGGLGNGLTVGALEDEDEEGVIRLPGLNNNTSSNAPRRRQKVPRTNRRGEIYSDDESDYAGRRRTREDEYDVEDDFLAPSDEEEEEEEGGDESESDAAESPKPYRSRSSNGREESSTKRVSRDDAEGDIDSEGQVDTEAPVGSPNARNKRRRIVEDEEDDD